MRILYECKNNEEYIITHTPNVHLLSSLGVFEGSKVIKKATYRNGGPVLLNIEGREVAIGKGLALLIEVEDEVNA